MAAGVRGAEAPRESAGPKRRAAHRRGLDRRQALQIAVHLASLAPLVVLIWDGVHGHLTVNPIQDITFRTGKYALVLLVASLACTPVNTILGLRLVLSWRRPLGMYAFLYATLHFLTFTVLDYGLDFGLLRDAVFDKRYALVGFAAFVLLVPLAITSTRGWMRRLGKGWKRLHQLVYPAAILSIVHFLWLVKADRREPMMWGAAVTALLVLRFPPVKRGILWLRQYRGRKTLRGLPVPTPAAASALHEPRQGG